MIHPATGVFDSPAAVLAWAFRRGPTGNLLFQVLLWGEMKKSGKTYIAALLVLWWAFTNPDTEIINAANDLEQSVGRVFRTVVALIKRNPALAASAKILATEVRLSNGTVISAIASVAAVVRPVTFEMR